MKEESSRMGATFHYPKSRVGRTLLGVSLLQGLIVVILEVAVALQVFPRIDTDDTRDKNRGIPVYMFIFGASQVWSVVLAWDAILRQNTIQLIGFVMFNLCTFLYSLFQLSQFSKIGEVAITAPYIMKLIAAVLGVFTFIFGYLAYKLYLEFGWKIYKKIGADPSMKNMFRSYQVLLTVLKIDLFFLLGFSVQFLVLVLTRDDIEFAITVLALPVSVLIVAIAVYGLRQESKPVMLTFMVGLVLGIGYFLFKLVRIWTLDRDRFANTQLFLTFFASISLIMFVATLGVSIACYMNFGKGLKTHLTNPDPNNNNSVRPSHRQSLD